MQPQREREHHHHNRFSQPRQHGVTLSFLKESSTPMCVTTWLEPSPPEMFHRKNVLRPTNRMVNCPQTCHWNEHLAASASLQNQPSLVCWSSCCSSPPRWPSVRRIANPTTLIARNRATNACFVSSRTARSSRRKR